MSDNFAPKPNENEPWDVAIVGSGPAGFTGAIYTTRGAASTLILAGHEWGGQLMLTTEVDNYPGFPQGIQGPDLMKQMRAQAERFGAEIVEQKAVEINIENKPFIIKTDSSEYKANAVVLATGAETKWLGVEGESRLRGRGVSSCAPCDAPFFKDKKVAVIGGGDSAMEEALVLTKYSSEVTLIHRRGEFKASAAMQDRVMNSDKINVLWDTEVVEMMGENLLESIKLKTKSDSQKSGDISNVESESDGYKYWNMAVNGVFVAIGHTPATEIFKGKIELDEKGYIKKYEQDGFKTKTSVDGVFVAGDVHDYHYRQAITAAGFGCMAAMDALHYLDKPTPSW